VYYIPKHTRELKKIKAEVHKAEAWDIKKKKKKKQPIRPFKTEKKGGDGKVLTYRTCRRRLIVNQSPGSLEKDQKDTKRE
jgi:hypothetical protein